MGRQGWAAGGIAVLMVVLLTRCDRGGSAAGVALAPWQVDSVPSLVIGGEGDTVSFSTISGATRLPDGRVLVGDVADFALHLFSPEGTLLRRFGRKGNGPGEIGYLARLMRCGDSLYTQDIDPPRISAFSLDGAFARSFRFGAGQAGRQPYASACNANRIFVHYGWEPRSTMRGGAYRAQVPFWLTPGDTTVTRELGTFPGSERFGNVVAGQYQGSSPQVLGKQTSIAIGPSRVYIGTADRFEILAFDLAGAGVDTLRKVVEPAPVTLADIASAREKMILEAGEKSRARMEKYFETLTFPATLAAYAKLIVDAEGLLWVQEFARSQSRAVRWTVFGTDGAVRAEVMLPADLEVYEIGPDYVLGRYLEAGRGIPEIREYRFVRRVR